MIKALLFDFYGVFVPDAYDTWLRNNQLRREGVFAEIIKQSNQGDMKEDDFLQALSGAIGRPVTSDEIHPATSVPDFELVTLVRELQPLYKIGLLSNASIRLREKLQKLGLDTLFDTIIVSSEIGHAKPSSEAFTTASDKIGVSVSEIFFIDDSLINIEAAQRMGMQSARYTGVAALRETLRSRTIL